jgi:hypothetical protein
MTAKKPVFIPSDSDVDVLIGNASVICKAYLQLLRDTAAQPYEVSSLHFKDISVENSKVQLIKANGESRTVPISKATVDLILTLHHRRDQDYLFDDVDAIFREFDRIKAALARDDPRFGGFELAGIRQRTCIDLASKNGLESVMQLTGTKTLLETGKLCLVCPKCQNAVAAKLYTNGPKDWRHCVYCGNKFFTTNLLITPNPAFPRTGVATQ